MKLDSINMFSPISASFGERTAAADMFGRKQRGRAAVFAPFLNGQYDPVEQKRALAKKQAYKMVGDAFAGERKIDDDLKEREDAVSRYQQSMGEANRKIREIDEKKEALRQEYGVDADSQEQKDLEILEKFSEDPFRMSQEEQKRALELYAEGKAGGYTEYQKRALEWNAAKEPYLDDLYKAKKGIIEENAAIRSITQERLKHHPVLDAVENAEDILEDASKDIIGLLQSEAVDHIDEKFEEEIEKAEESREEKKEEQKKLEEAKKHREEMEALANPEKAEKNQKRTEGETDVLSGDPVTEAMLKMDDVKNDIKQEISDMVTKMNLAAEDIKGIKVDELL